MAGAGGNIEQHGEFNLDGWCESRGGECKSLTWGIQHQSLPDDPGGPIYPEGLKNNVPLLMEFDAEQKTLFVRREFCKLFGVKLSISDGNGNIVEEPV
jgi:hypothetical protein